MKNINLDWTCRCGEVFRTRRALYAHRKVCDKVRYCEQLEQQFDCEFCGKTWKTTVSGYKTHIKFCKCNPNRVDTYWTGKTHSDESKLKISKSVKKAHDEGRGHTWKNRYNNPSFAEKWLYSVLNEMGVSYEKEFPFYGFFLDTAIIEKGICIEIDGEQHYDPIRFPEQIESDKRKDELLKNNGWIELRLRWSDVQKNRALSKSIIKDFIENNYSDIVVSKLNELKNKRIEDEKRRTLLVKEKRIDKLGRIQPKMINDDEWKRRKNLIINSGIDLTKFGCLIQIEKVTGLTRSQIRDTIKKFNIEHKTHKYN